MHVALYWQDIKSLRLLLRAFFNCLMFKIKKISMFKNKKIDLEKN